jgi:hypothetical protein
MSDVKSFIRDQVRRILFEENQAPAPAAPSSSKEDKSSSGDSAQRGPRVVRGRVGKGNFSKATKLTGSLVDKSPADRAELVKKLGLKAANGSTNVDKVMSIVKSAISGASIMRDTYPGAEIMQDEEGTKFIRVATSSKVEIRDAAQYMYLVFIAAEKEGLLAGINANIIPGIVGAKDGQILAVLVTDATGSRR